MDQWWTQSFERDYEGQRSTATPHGHLDFAVDVVFAVGEVFAAVALD